MGRTFIFLIVSILLLPVFTNGTFGQQPSLYRVDRLPFNTSGFSEISPVLLKDGLLFCSDKRFSIIKDRMSFDGRRIYNLYLAHMEDSSSWQAPKELRSERSSLFNNGPFCLSPDGRTVYLTSEIETGDQARKKSFRNHSGIFIAELAGDELVSMKPFRYNSTGYDIAQPSLSSDGRYLYFASNMPGGIGGSDLYQSELVNGEWSQPVNLGPGVNSPGSENFPFLHQSGRLYFTSDRAGGTGNLDIYYSARVDGKYDEPVRLPEPINSPADDFAFVATDDLQRGYFSSNRNNSDDIFRFVSTIIRKAVCNAAEENSYCYRFVEENSLRVDTMPFRYEWRFGDGQSASGKIVEHCYEGPGTYIVQLDVVNLITNEISYNEKSDTLVVTRIEQAYISCADSIQAGQKILLNSDETNLPGWNIGSFYWNFGDETAAIGSSAEKTFIKPGIYNVQLIVFSVSVPGVEAQETCVSKNIRVFGSHEP